MDDISIEDIFQLYNGSVCLYKGEPVKVVEILGRNEIVLRSLEFSKKFSVKFSFDYFSAPIGRIGFVNHGNLAVYVTRRPLRQWAVGLKNSNIKCRLPLIKVDIEHLDKLKAIRDVGKMELKAMAMSLKNNYPSFADALKLAVNKKGVFAFDKQFAVDYERNIYYKTRHVGRVPRGTNLEKTVFTPGNDYLLLPLIQHYEKTIRVFG